MKLRTQKISILIVYVNKVTPICEMCVADELGRYTKADAKNSQNKD